ncbi:MAG: XRE family transcriptional regulator [Alphaproteobacteria bacterium]|nr:XRE family transcriptional regulator [Alphaproteobacteria bacterium]
MELLLSRDAQRNLSRMPAAVRINLIARLKALAADPAGLKERRHASVKDFGAGLYRLRVSKWRAVFRVRGDEMMVTRDRQTRGCVPMSRQSPVKVSLAPGTTAHGHATKRTAGSALMSAPRSRKPSGGATVTLSRADYEALVEAAEDRFDLARHRAIMREAKPSDFIPIEVVEARLAGDNLLRAWRKKRGLTLVALAAASGLSHAFLSLLENGKKEATTTTLKKLAAALKIEPGDLI